MLNVARDWTDTLGGDDDLNPRWALRLPTDRRPWRQRLAAAWRRWRWEQGWMR